MDFSWLSSLGTNIGNGIGNPPARTGAQGYENFQFGTVPVRPAMAVVSPANASMGVPGGQLGGAGMGAPAGSSPASSGGGGGSPMGGIADAIKGIGTAIANYTTAGAQGKQEVAAATPGMTVQPVLATFSVPPMMARRN